MKQAPFNDLIPTATSGGIPCLVLGVGSESRGDDGAGLLVVDMLKAISLPPSVSLEKVTGDGTMLMALWKGAQQVIIVGAVTAGLPPGATVRIDARRELIPSSLFAASSHSFGVAQALAISLALNELPPVVTLFGIQAGQFQAGRTLSAEVERGAKKTAEGVLNEILSHNPNLLASQEMS